MYNICTDLCNFCVEDRCCVMYALFFVCKDSCKRCVGDMCFAVMLRSNYFFTQAHGQVELELDILPIG